MYRFVFRLKQVLILLVLLVFVRADSEQQKPVAPFFQAVYVWQRHWTPALNNALIMSRTWVTEWHILAAEVGTHGRFLPITIDYNALLKTNKPVVLVIRINGQLTDWQPETVIQASLRLVVQWRKAGISVIGLEIDHDCATARLDNYAHFLTALRQAMQGQKLGLTITVLPTWMGSPKLQTVLKSVDEAVLQVHSVARPQDGLLNPNHALRWVEKFSQITPMKFRIALPNYGSRIAWDAKGHLLAVESEVTQGLIGSHTHEVTVNPTTVSTLLQHWQQKQPRAMNGIIWFRLPTAEDKRAWSLNTWHAVMTGQPLQPHFIAQLIPTQTPAVFDIFIQNDSEIDGIAPHALRLVSDTPCESADALAAYQLLQSPTEIVFQLVDTLTLHAHQRRIVGWVRCSSPKLKAYVTP